MSNLYDRLLKKDAKLAVIGLGYVGLPIALAFARKIKVVGFDINQKRVDMMRRGEDPSNELDAKEFEGCDIHFSADLNDLKDVEFFIVAVPTPIDSQNIPDLGPLLGATRTVGQVLKKNDFVVYESTVYPGCTEEDCVPLLERLSNLKFVEDFKVGYSPERINPGDKAHTIESIVKVTSGSTPVTVVTPTVTLQTVTVGGGLQTTQQTANLSGPVPAGGGTVTLTSVRPSLVNSSAVAACSCLANSIWLAARSRNAMPLPATASLMCWSIRPRSWPSRSSTV